MAGINFTAAPQVESKEDFVGTIAREVKKAAPRFSAAQCLEVAYQIGFLIANPHLNPLRAKAVAAGLL